MVINLEIDYFKYAVIAIFISIVFVFTVIIAISIPATRGFWNVGEAGVYLSALIAGPIVGCIAGGIGSALADIVLGYAYYAPGTLTIKGAEGFITGYIYHSIRSKIYQSGHGSGDGGHIDAPNVGLQRNVAWKYYVSILVALIVGAVGYVTYYFGFRVGEIEISLELEPLGRSIGFHMNFIYLVLFVVVLGFFIIFLLLVEKEMYLMIFSCLVGGVVMVFGYFLYETLVLGGEIALIEVLPNFLQSIIGIALSIPVVRKLEEMGALDKYRELVGKV